MPTRPAAEAPAEVVVAHRNNVPALTRLLTALREQTEPCAVCVVDDASTDETPEVIPREFPEVRYERLDTNVEFAAGETIWTESSYKFDLLQLNAMAAAAGFVPEQEWVDQEWPFAEMLWRVPAR